MTRRPWLFPVLVLMALALGLGLGSRLGDAPPAAVEPPASPAPTAAPLAARQMHALPVTMQAASIPDVAEAVMPSVVSIFTLTKPTEDPVLSLFGIHHRGQPTQGLGSGVIVDASGIVVTNNHVVAGADRIQVNLSDGRAFPAELIGRDEATDLAVIRFTEPVSDLKAIPLGDSDELRLGEFVLAVGNPFGLSGSVTLGIVSALGRGGIDVADYEDFIQTDAAINPGNSGGALIDSDGNLVGINTAISSRSGGYDGIGFAIPTNMVRPVLDKLLKFGRIDRSFLGVGLEQVNPQVADQLELTTTTGAIVTRVWPRTPAAAAGLRAGDVVVAMDGEPVSSVRKLRNELALAGVGTEVELGILRGGQQTSVTTQLARMPTRRR
jgi:serine protease Do